MWSSWNWPDAYRAYPSGNHTWLAGKSPINVINCRFPSMFDYRRVALAIYAMWEGETQTQTPCCGSVGKCRGSLSDLWPMTKAIQYGKPFLFENLDEELDPMVEAWHEKICWALPQTCWLAVAAVALHGLRILFWRRKWSFWMDRRWLPSVCGLGIFKTFQKTILN